MSKAIKLTATVYPTSDKKKLASGEIKEYNYGAINLRAPELKQFVGKRVKVTITESLR